MADRHRAWMKVREAQYFYELMLQQVDNPERFGFCLNAFQVAGRSVESYLKSGHKADPPIKDRPTSVRAFFRDSRNLNVHLYENKHDRRVNHPMEAITFGEGDEAEFLYLCAGDAEPVGFEGPFAEPTDPGPPPAAPKDLRSRLYFFEGYPGPDPAIVVACHAYLLELRAIVQSA